MPINFASAPLDKTKTPAAPGARPRVAPSAGIKPPPQAIGRPGTPVAQPPAAKPRVSMPPVQVGGPPKQALGRPQPPPAATPLQPAAPDATPLSPAASPSPLQPTPPVALQQGAPQPVAPSIGSTLAGMGQPANYKYNDRASVAQREKDAARNNGNPFGAPGEAAAPNLSTEASDPGPQLLDSLGRAGQIQNTVPPPGMSKPTLNAAGDGWSDETTAAANADIARSAGYKESERLNGRPAAGVAPGTLTGEPTIDSLLAGMGASQQNQMAQENGLGFTPSAGPPPPLESAGAGGINRRDPFGKLGGPQVSAASAFAGMGQPASPPDYLDSIAPPTYQYPGSPTGEMQDIAVANDVPVDRQPIPSPAQMAAQANGIGSYFPGYGQSPVTGGQGGWPTPAPGTDATAMPAVVGQSEYQSPLNLGRTSNSIQGRIGGTPSPYEWNGSSFNMPTVLDGGVDTAFGAGATQASIAPAQNLGRPATALGMPDASGTAVAGGPPTPASRQQEILAQQAAQQQQYADYDRQLAEQQAATNNSQAGGIGDLLNQFGVTSNDAATGTTGDTTGAAVTTGTINASQLPTYQPVNTQRLGGQIEARAAQQEARMNRETANQFANSGTQGRGAAFSAAKNLNQARAQGGVESALANLGVEAANQYNTNAPRFGSLLVDLQNSGNARQGQNLSFLSQLLGSLGSYV